MTKDPRIAAAKQHWAGRMISNGVPLADFEDVTGSIDRWDDWCAAWDARGEVHEGLAEAALAQHRRLSAGQHYVTAAACYHFGKFLFVEDPAQMRRTHEKAVAAYRAALPLLSPPGERVAIPYAGGTLYGNLRLPAGIERPPVVIMIMGLDSAKEEMFTNESVFLERGMATLAFDGPGQGEAEYDQPICPEYERPVAAVIEFLKGRPDVDAGSIGLWGVSMGGYYAPRAAAHCPEARACIALSGPFDMAECFDMLPGLTRSTFIHRSGAKDAEEARAVAARMTLAEAAGQIACPLYIVTGSLDRVIPPDHGKRLADAATSAAEVIHHVVPDGGHVANNRAYAYRTAAADWMAARLGVKDPV